MVLSHNPGMGLTLIVVVLGGLGFAGAAFFFALAETALFSLGKWQARQLAQKEPRLGGMVLQLLKEPQELLATMVLGNTLASAALLATVLWTALGEGWHLALPLAGLLLVLFLGCEVFPKTLAVRRAEQWSMRVARPMLFLHSLARPLRQIALRLNTAILRAFVPQSFKPQTALTDDEYRELLEMAFQQGALAKSEKEIILQIIRLDRRTVKEIARPRSQMACISDDLSVEEMLAAARRYKHRRLPIYDETPDTIVGVLNTRALLLDPQIDVAEVIEFPSFVPETMNLLQLLKSLQRQQRGLAIVLDEYGQTDGIITLEDIMAELVGELRSEGVAEGFVMERLAAGKWRVNGTMRLDDFRREYPEIGDVPEVETMGGLLVSQLEVVPVVGQAVTCRGLRLTAQVADERRVRELLVEVVKKKGGG